MICLLGNSPGLTAAQVAARLWPHLHKQGRWNPALLAAEHVGKLKLKKLVWLRIVPTNFHKGGTVRPVGRYYLTESGYAAYEYWERFRKG